MRRFAVFCVALAVAMLVWADSTQAQDQGQGRRGQGGAGRQGRGGQGFGGFGQRGGGRNSLEGLLRMDEVKTEIDLTEDQGSEISEFVEGLEQPQFDFQALRDATDEERAEIMAELAESRAKLAAQIREKIEATLLEPQMKRLNEIYVQALGINGLNDAWIAGQLGLSDEQKAKLSEMQPAFGGRGGRGGRGRGGDAGGGQSREEREAAMLAVLTEEQQAKYEEMKGEEFEFPQRGRGGRGAGGRGGRGGRGGAGGGDGGGL